MKIRRYIPSDQAAVLQLFDWNTPQYINETERAGLVHLLKSEIEDYFVVEIEGQIVGAGGINYEPQSKAAVISCVYVYFQWSHGIR